MFKIEYFQNDNGTYPAEEFILSQNYKMQARIFRTLDLLEQKGNGLREPYSKYLGEGIFEIRAKQGTDITRVLYFFIEGKNIILTNGFVKKTQETPRRIIEQAKKFRKIYYSRKA